MRLTVWQMMRGRTIVIEPSGRIGSKEEEKRRILLLEKSTHRYKKRRWFRTTPHTSRYIRAFFHASGKSMGVRGLFISLSLSLSLSLSVPRNDDTRSGDLPLIRSIWNRIESYSADRLPSHAAHTLERMLNREE